MPDEDRPTAADRRTALPGVLLAAEVLLLALGIWGLARSSVWQTVAAGTGALVIAAIVVVITAGRRELNVAEMTAHLRLIRFLQPYLIGVCVLFGALMVGSAAVDSRWWLAGLVPAVGLPLANQAQIKRLVRLSQSAEPAGDSAP